MTRSNYEDHVSCNENSPEVHSPLFAITTVVAAVLSTALPRRSGQPTIGFKLQGDSWGKSARKLHSNPNTHPWSKVIKGTAPILSL